MLQSEYAVVDIETTGFAYSRSDRIVEIAIVTMSGRGVVHERYETLVNPNRDVGAIHIHGIEPKDLVEAPLFEEIVGDVIERIAGRVFVAHNAVFDSRFLRAEIARCGYEIPELPILCTMRLAKCIVPCIRGTLAACCEQFGLPLNCAHTAVEDACAAAELLRVCLERAVANGSPTFSDLGVVLPVPPKDHWPTISCSCRQCSRDTAKNLRETRPSAIAALIEKLPVRGPEVASIEPYLALLDKVLMDRIITEEEAVTLFEIGMDLGMTRGDVELAHSKYLKDLIVTAYTDEVLTDFEQQDIQTVRKLLHIPERECQELLYEVKSNSQMRSREASPDTSKLSTVAGRSVCFTGTLKCVVNGESISREKAEQLAGEAGMIVKNGVTRGLNYLVTADPYSMSGKAKKAREYGVTIVAEAVFWQLLGIKAQ